jgi:hypothetical protein
MLKVDKENLGEMEIKYPGIRETILHFEETKLPVCPRCGSDDTASVQSGIIGRTINISAATTKFKLTRGLRSRADTSAMAARIILTRKTADCR